MSKTQDIMLENINISIIQAMHSGRTTAQELLKIQPKNYKNLNMNRINESKAELVIATTEDNILAINFKKEMITKTMNDSDISQDTVERAKMRLKHYKNAEKEESKMRLKVETICDSWGSNIKASEVAKLLTIIKALRDLTIQIAKSDNPEND